MPLDKVLIGLIVTSLAIVGGFRLIASDEEQANLQRDDAAAVTPRLEQRLMALEKSHKALQARLAELERGSIPALDAGSTESETGSPEPAAEQPATPESAAQRQTTRDSRFAQRIEQAGLTTEEYGLLETRAYELYLENFEQEWLQRREAWLNGERRPDSRDRLRAELGDEAYDRYLYASGSPNRVRVRQVMPGSAAQLAGLKDGDVVLRYDGERLFDFEDLREASYRGEPGESVILEVRRADGTSAQLVIPRGPMGISGQGGWRDAPNR
jgi:membrane-associated protease RseP (regulator of RpoE activity)